MKKLIIAANLGNIRVLKYREAGEDPLEQEHLVEASAESAKEHVGTIHETVTDQSGRFGRGSQVGFQTGMSYGEEHELKASIEKAALKKIVSHIESILATEGWPQWSLAAPRSMLATLEESLSTNARKTLLSSIGSDLTRCPLKEMEKRFLS